MAAPASGRGGTSAGKGSGGGFTDPLEEFRALLSVSRLDPTTCVSVLRRALSHPRVHAGYVELLSLAPVDAALSKLPGDGAGDRARRTLELFAYGTYRQYADSSGGATYWELTPQQVLKLRMLTVVTLVREGGRGRNAGTIPYGVLASELGLPAPDASGGGVRELEDVLIHCVYAGLVSARLDQKTMSLVVVPHGERVASSSSSAGGSGGGGPCLSRDVRSSDVPSMIASLETFLGRSERLLHALGERSQAARAEREREIARWADVKNRVDDVRSRLSSQRSSTGVVGVEGGLGMGAGGGEWASAEAMDVSYVGEDVGGGGGGRSGLSIGRRQVKRSKGGHSTSALSGEGFRRI